MMIEKYFYTHVHFNCIYKNTSMHEYPRPRTRIILFYMYQDPDRWFLIAVYDDYGIM